MKKTTAVITACVISFVLILLGCNTAAQTSGNGTSTLHVSPNGSNSRAIATPDTSGQIQSYRVVITGGVNPPAAQSFNANEPIVFTGVSYANGYTVSIAAHNTTKDNQSVNTILGSGSQNFNVSGSNTTVQVVVPVGTVTQTVGRGSINLTLLYPVAENITGVSAVMSGTGAPAVTVVLGSYSATYGSATFTTGPIQSGAYSMEIIFDRGSGNSKTSIMEEVMVYDNAITNRWIVDSAGRYDTQRVYDNIFTSTYAYLAGFKFNTTGTVTSDPNSGSFVNLPYFISEKLTDTSYYVIHSAEQTLQFVPVFGRPGQSISYAISAQQGNGGDRSEGDNLTWYKYEGTSDSETLPNFNVTNATLYVKVTAPDGITQVTYQFTIIQDYKLFYNANAADSGTPPATATYKKNDVPQVLGNTGALQKNNMVFGGWNTAADGSGTTYFPGNWLPSMTQSVSLYAYWTKAGLSFSISTVNPNTAVIIFDVPNITPQISKDDAANNRLTVNLAHSGVTYKANSTIWSYTTGVLVTPVVVTAAQNGAADANTALIWTPGIGLPVGDYIFSVQTTIMVYGKEVPCTGYFRITVVD